MEIFPQKVACGRRLSCVKVYWSERRVAPNKPPKATVHPEYPEDRPHAILDANDSLYSR